MLIKRQALIHGTYAIYIINYRMINQDVAGSIIELVKMPGNKPNTITNVAKIAGDKSINIVYFVCFFR